MAVPHLAVWAPDTPLLAAGCFILLDSMEVPPNVVITDIFMPNKDGIEMVTALAKRQFAGELILASGADPIMLRVAQAMALAGGLSVLATLLKPLDEQALRNVFARLNGS